MTKFESIKSKNIDEFAEWLDKYGAYDGSEWCEWFDKNYCRKCESEYVYVEMFKNEQPCAWCELHNKCKFFEGVNDIPDNKQIIKMWLETEIEDE
jgi:hypothetical protein